MKEILSPQQACQFVLNTPGITLPQYPLDAFDEFDYYELLEVNIADIVQVDLVEGYLTDLAERLKRNHIPEAEWNDWRCKYSGEHGPIVIGSTGMIFDGMHRIALNIKSGRSQILAYVGFHSHDFAMQRKWGSKWLLVSLDTKD